MRTDFRERLHSGEFLLGTWVTTSDPALIEAIGGAGLDFVIIDTEHSPYSPESLQMTLMALAASPTAALVRVGSLEAIELMRPLDLGADGIVIPRVRTAEEVEHIVRWTRYPPVGLRGFGPRRAGDYTRSERPYVDSTERRVTVVPMIETAEAVENLDAIAAVEGIDGLLVGRNDLSGSIGLEWQPSHPTVLGIVDRVVEVCRERGIASGIASGFAHEDVQGWEDRGLRLVAAGLDYEWMRHGADDLASYKRREATPGEAGSAGGAYS
jgi:4-hydroxy-2-oxoheptanedioate aldolase